MEYTVKKTEYLDEQGLQELWEKIKAYVAEHGGGGTIDLSDYATKEYVTEVINNIPDIDLSHYVTNDALVEQLLNYATKDEIPSLEGYATKTYVTEAITNAQLGGAEIDTSDFAKTDGEGIVTDYSLSGTLLDTTLPAISLTSSTGFDVVTNFKFKSIGITNQSKDDNGFNINDYTIRTSSNKKATITPLHSGDILGFKDYYFTGVDYDLTIDVEDLASTAVKQYSNTTSGSPWGESVKVFTRCTDAVTQAIGGTYLSCMALNDLSTYTLYNIKYFYFDKYQTDWQNGFYAGAYYIYYSENGTNSYTAPTYSYIYKITAPTTSTGKVKISGLTGIYFAGSKWTSNTAWKPLGAGNTKTTLSSGETIWVLSNVEKSNIHVVDGTSTYESLVNKQIEEAGDFDASMTITDKATSTSTTYTFTLPSKSTTNYTGNEYIRYSSSNMYKRYDYRDVQEDSVNQGITLYDKIPTVGYMQSWVENYNDEIIMDEINTAISNASLGSDIDLSAYALKSEIPTVPTKVSAFTNDAGYLTEHQDLSAYALKTEIPDTSNFAEKNHTHTEYQEKGDYASANHNHDNVYLKEHQSLEGYLRYEVVTTVPDTQVEGVLYIVTG